MRIPIRMTINIDMRIVNKAIRAKVPAKDIRKAVADEVRFLIDSMLVEGVDVQIPTERHMIRHLIEEGLAEAA